MDFKWPEVGEQRRIYLTPPFFIKCWDWFDDEIKISDMKWKLKWGIAILDTRAVANINVI
jgi:hypothetical protein